jgi:hypothetical protein
MKIIVHSELRVYSKLSFFYDPDCLKGKIFITAGRRPAEYNHTLTLPERQDF